ncbi:helix-turn-helix domain-containing protein [Asanoa iriomotensis]|uniref:Transcriptional regulator n=1 Tax=Asanoa iriomotensis TaxID=234613 RepID=A0ABQ4C2F7_9ACTN|nr:helix-turn-helix transcriptional regulator [Asanoa iriomotensis]GIF56470.1 transcriptional regulator [Asanoa iriomotensis]
MSPTHGAHFDPDDSLGPTLARLRRAKNLTGRELGKLVDMSQPKISRLENGVGLPDPADIERVARALDAPDDLVRQLVALAEQAQNMMTDWRTSTLSLPGRQHDIGEIESGVRELRVFQPTVIPGLLQTSEYARGVLTSYQRVLSPALDAAANAAVAEAVSARMARQEILADPARRFHFLIMEAVLESRVCAPEYMPAQIQRLREVAKQENVTVGLLPTDSDVTTLPMSGFVLADDAVVIIDLLNTSISTRGKLDAAAYRQAFDALAKAAITEIDPLLDRHMDRFLRAMRQTR